MKKKEKQYRQFGLLLITILKLLDSYEAKSGKESPMDQELDICNRVYEIATYNMRRVCVTFKKYNVNKPPIQIRTSLHNNVNKHSDSTHCKEK